MSWRDGHGPGPRPRWRTSCWRQPAISGSAPAPCRFCGGPTRRRLAARDFNRRISGEWFDYNLCSLCGTTSISAVPADLARYYPTDYYPLPPSRDELARTALHETYKIDLVSRYVHGGRLLEIGPGAGGFAYLARQAGFDVETMEMDERTCAFMREVVGVRAMQTSEPQTALSSTGLFDVIALWHVLEHLPNPEDLLQSAARALKPGGVLVIAVPNPRALQFGLFRRYWAHLDAPRHLALMPADAIAKSATAAGLEVVLQTSTDVGGLGWNAFGWQMSLRNLVPGLPPIFARAAARVMRPVERRDLNGATYTLVLKKVAGG